MAYSVDIGVHGGVLSGMYVGGVYVAERAVGPVYGDRTGRVVRGGECVCESDGEAGGSR